MRPVSKADDEQMEALTVDLVCLNHVNATTVTQTITQTRTKHNVDLNKVTAFLTDNASYMTKAIDFLCSLLPNCVHMTCNAHILSLVCETWRKNFPTVDRLVACFKSIFVHCASRQQRYKEHLSANLPLMWTASRFHQFP